MSDLESRLTEVLQSGAEGAPSALGLAGAARSRARSRRRARVGGAAVLAVLAIGVPAAVMATRGSDDSQPPPVSHDSVAKDPEGVTGGAPAGFHYESWHDVSVLVPDSWKNDDSPWCAGGGSLDDATVSRPGGIVEAIGCVPGTGYGVTFQPLDAADGSNQGDFEWPLAQQGKGWPKDAYVGAHGVAGVLVQVVVADPKLGQQILDSVQQNSVLDPDGCPVSADNDPVVPDDDMVVCRYDTDNLLEQSEVLHGADVTAAEAAIAAAPVAAPPSQICSPVDTSGFLVRMASVADDVVASAGCYGGELRVQGGQFRSLTPDVLYWALSPGWSGSVPAGVELPSVLRQR
jgi:hypothetical protein